MSAFAQPAVGISLEARTTLVVLAVDIYCQNENLLAGTETHIFWPRLLIPKKSL